MTSTFIFTLLCGATKTCYLWRDQKELLTKICHFSTLFGIQTTKFKIVFVKLLTYDISASLIIEIHKDNIDTPRVTNEQYYTKILFQKILSNKTDISRESLPNTTV